MKKIDLKEIMMGMQAQMDAKLSLSRRTLTHPVAIGDVAELEWIDLLSEYLPKRYSVGKGFVVDAESHCSDQIDVVIYDKHFTPFVFHQNGVKYIPAEAVYAVIECKQQISPSNIAYAAKKARSVRRLNRTSIPIQHAGGIHDPKPLHNILAGLVCVGGKVSGTAQKKLVDLPASECVNFICSLPGTYTRVENFDLWKKNTPPYKIASTDGPLSLVTFVLTLISDLQTIGTVPAIDVSGYLRALKGES